MNNMMPSGELVLAELGIESGDIKSIKPRRKRSHYRAVVNWLTEYQPHANASNLEKVKAYLEAFHHLCEVEDWQRATTIINIPLNTPTNEKLRDILGTWGYYQQQKEIFDRLLGKLNDEWECICLNGLGRYYYSTGRYQSAINYFNQSLAIAQENTFTKEEGRILTNLGCVYLEIGNYRKAIDILSQAWKITKAINNRLGEGGILTNLGSTYDSIGNYSKAIKCHTKGLDIARENVNRYQECIALGGIGNVHFSLKDYHLAMTYYQQQLKIAEEIGDRQNIKTALGNIGVVYLSLKKYSEAITYLEQILQLATEIGDINGEETALLNLGLVEFESGNLTQAREYFEKALNIAREIGDRRGKAIILFSLGQYYYRCGKPQKSLTASYQALKIMGECGVTVNALPLPRWYKSLLKFSQKGKWKLILFLLFVLIGFPCAIIASLITTWWSGLRAQLVKNWSAPQGFLPPTCR